MRNLYSVKTDVRQALEDPDGKRYTDDLLETAVRQALDEINLRLPRTLSAEISIETTSREVPLPGLTDWLYLVCVTLADGRMELEPDAGFTYFLKDGEPVLRFTGDKIPQAGETLSVVYAAANTLAGLDEVETTTLPDACESALVTGAAGQACLLRAGALAESYGSHPRETAGLLESGRLRLELFTRSLDGLKVMQAFGFPPGFALDQWDRIGR